MSVIKNFVIICRKCKEKSKINIAWNPHKAMIFVCYNCETIEVNKVDEPIADSREEWERRNNPSEEPAKEKKDRLS